MPRLLLAAALLATPAPLLAPLLLAQEAGESADVADPIENEPIVLELVGGTRLRGTIVSDTPGGILLDHPILGEIEISTNEIAQRLPADARLGPKAKEEDPIPPGLFGTSFLYGWEKNIALGIGGKEGDQTEFNFTASAEGDYEDDDKRWKFRSAYFFGKTDGVQSKDQGFANLRRDWLMPTNPLFYWGELRGDYNGFQAYVVRAGGFGGVGVTLFGENDPEAVYIRDDFQLLARTGAGYTYEWGDVNEGMPEALAALESVWKITDNQTFRFGHTYFPSLDDLGESRNVTEASHTIKIDTARGLSLKIGVFNEYLSMTEDDSSHNSLTYFGQLQYAF